MTNWEIKVIEEPWMMMVKIYIVERGARNYLAHFKGNQLEMTEITEGGAIPDSPTMELPTDLWNIIRETIIDKKVEDKSAVEGELKATKYHLEDMRILAGVVGTVRRIK